MAPARNMVIACAAALAACSQRPAPSEPAAPAQPAQPAPPTQTQRSDVGCAAPLDAPGARAQIRTAAGKLRLGVLAGLKDADDVNVAHLRKLVAEIVRRGAEALVADGDVGDNPDEQETLLGGLTETGVAVRVV